MGENLDGAPYPQKIIVPYLNIVHDRIPLEIARVALGDAVSARRE